MSDSVPQAVGREDHERQVRQLEGAEGFGAISILTAAASVITYVWRSRWLIAGVAVIVAMIVGLGELATSAWPNLASTTLAYNAIFVSEFVGILAFGAITVAIGIWKFSFAETRFVQQAMGLRDKFLDLAYQIQSETGKETPGVIALKGVGEALDRAVFSPSRFKREDIDEWLKTLIIQPEAPKVRPAMLVAAQDIGVPMLERRLWVASVALALRYVVFCALTTLSLAALGPLAENDVVLWLSVLVVLVALQATLRFVS